MSGAPGGGRGAWAAVAAALLTGCGSQPHETADANLIDSEGLSYIGAHVAEKLSSPRLLPWRGKTWDITHGNSLDGGWFLPTVPPEWWGDALATLPMDTDCTDVGAGCDPDFHMRLCQSDLDCPSGSCLPVESSVIFDGELPLNMCVGHSDGLEDEIYRAIASAESFVDITSLWQPNGRFTAAIRNALHHVAASRRHVTVRILSADGPSDGPLAGSHTAEFIKELTSGFETDETVTIYVAKHSASFTSWNHAKIIAVDGKYAMVGGHNMDTEHYQLRDPVFDLSMRLRGPAAAAAHRFANQLWKVACKKGPAKGLVTYPTTVQGCPDPYDPPETKTGDVPVIAAGRLGAISDNPSDDALLAMVEAAKHTVYMSQQDLLAGRIAGPVAIAGPPKALLDRLAAAIARGVDVYLVMTNTEKGFFGSSYSNDWTAEETAQKVAGYMAKRTELFPKGTDISGLLCDKLHIASIRPSSADAWPDGHVFTNHAKFLMVDTTAFYTGSQNLYPADLAEYGFIVDSKDAAREVESYYWEPLWSSSKRVAVMGSEAATCVLPP